MVVSVVAWEIEGCISQLCKIQAQVPWGTVPAADRSGTSAQEKAWPLGLELPLLPDVPMVMQS